MPVRSDVIVIGAGPAGMTAAFDLINAGYDVKILEASNKIGGRIKKDDTFTDFPIDLGGEWLQSRPKVLNTIVGRNVVNEIDMTDYYMSTYYEYENGKFNTYNNQPNELDYTFTDSTWFDFFNDYISPTIIDDIAFHCIVNEIDYRTIGNIKVTCKNRDYSYVAKHVIVTVPLPILKSNSIRFRPNLSDRKLNALQKVKFHPGLKVFLKFKQKFYFNNFGYDKDQNTKDHERYFYDATYNKRSQQQGTTEEHILGMFAVGNPSKDYIFKSKSQIITTILNELDQMYGNNIATKSYTGMAIVQNWKKEPHIRGAYSNYCGGNYKYLRRLAKPIGNSIFFAGEAFPVDWENGFVHTAAISGKAAAYQIINGKKSATFLCNLYDGIDC